MHKTDSNSESYEVSATSSRPALSFSRDGGNREDDQGQIKSRMFTFAERMQDKSVSFFPPIMPSATVVSLETSKATVVLAFFTLQSASISFGGLAFFADGMYMAVRLVAGAEANDFQRYWQVGYYLIVIRDHHIAGRDRLCHLARAHHFRGLRRDAALHAWW
ncbi:unnamed protein product [Tilletia laevis]|uniref:Uncharacterized protein n=2 Tax=Tilletia TaxID=13289 RepID=A0A9N8QF68_9BASI|nr:unnamed protein product [Tilletia caries]CAD6928458.1 unnamed protein product [Tilletia laevis]CAD6937095.1 unnamed protein product [Tilletia laevis]CAD7064891.1 unnamed protein product [Tilletia caries]